jgi:hypothetical protein
MTVRNSSSDAPALVAVRRRREVPALDGPAASEAGLFTPERGADAAARWGLREEFNDFEAMTKL